MIHPKEFRVANKSEKSRKSGNIREVILGSVKIREISKNVYIIVEKYQKMKNIFVIYF